MIDWEKYDPARDANEEESHLCNSLNSVFTMARHIAYDPAFKDIEYVPVNKKFLANAADYMERAQATIGYLQRKVEEYEKYNSTRMDAK